MRTILAGLLLCTAFAVGDAHAQLKTELNAEPTAEDIARGKALTDAGDCASCHTADPAKPFAGGKRIDTPFGGIYSPNLTPDRDTGLGAWSDDDFYRALRFGVAPDGSRYYPAFPYPNFTKLTRQDIFAIRAYLATLTPVRNTPPRARTALAAELSRRDARLELAVLQARHSDAGPAKERGMESAAAIWSRASAIAAPAIRRRTCLAPTDAARPTAATASQGMFAPRLDAAARSGLKSWSVEDIAEYLQSGRNGKSHAGELMSEVVVNSTSKMSDADVRAIAVYLKDLPAGTPEPKVTPPPPAQMAAGEKLYNGACIACHEADGSGAPRIYPPLPDNANLQSADASSTLRIILDGAQTVTTAARAQQGIDAGLCRENDRPADRRRDELYPQRLGQCRAAGDGGSGREGAADEIARDCRRSDADPPLNTNFGISHL